MKSVRITGKWVQVANEGFVITQKGSGNRAWLSDKVFNTRDEARAFIRDKGWEQDASVADADKAKAALDKWEESVAKHFAKREKQQEAAAEKRRRAERKKAAANWPNTSSANKVFRAIRSQLAIVPDAEFPSKTTFIKWIDAEWENLVDFG